MKITLISPNIVSQKGDVAGTGIPYIPISLVYLATYLKSKRHEVQFIDMFSENPFKVTERKGFLFQGITPKEAAKKIFSESGLIVLYAGQVYAHASLLNILKEVRVTKKPVLVVENTQAVTAYSLQHTYKDFLDNGADYVLAGEAEPRIDDFLAMLQGKKKPPEVDGLIYKDEKRKVIFNPKLVFQEPDLLPFPDWDFINIKNYWRLGYAHAPLTTGKYLPILTSRGCPLMCRFCVTPATNSMKWRPRSAENVVEELAAYSKKFGVKEFHIEDLNPTVNRNRIVDICKLLIKKRLKLMLKFAAGTKAETFGLDTIDWMAKAGFNYISISPESGSPNVLRLMKKYFNHEQALKQVRKMHELKITSQACFVLGYPGEKKEDLKMSQQYAGKLARAGLDEIALFIMTPVPGSEAFEMVSPHYKNISELTFTPKWRKEYKYLAMWRRKILITFAFNKAFYHPIKTLGNLASLITRRFKTKTEMTIYRLIKTHFLFKRAKQV